MKACFAATDELPREWFYINYFTELAVLDKMRVHTLTTDPDEADLLFSFMGANNHPVRRHVLRLAHPRAYIEDTSCVKIYDFTGKGDPEQLALRRKLFAEVLSRSKYILCPRGYGTSAFRIFESLQAGRVPVITRDECMEPEGPD